MRKIITILIAVMIVVNLSACGGEKTANESKENQNKLEEISSSFKMEKVEAGKYSFLVPDNGEKKFSNGDSIQKYYSDDGEEGRVWYSLEGPIEIPKDEAAALNVVSASGKIVEFEQKNRNGHDYAFIINELEDKYEGLMLVSNSSDTKDCMWLSVKGTDKKLIEKILKSLEW